MKETLAHAIHSLIQEIVILDSEIILLTILLVIATIVIDSLSAFASEKKESSGAVKLLELKVVERSL
jgi:hypothetical protein